MRDFVLGGKIAITCKHGKVKRVVAQIEHMSNQHVFICVCCENLYINNTDEPLPCFKCREGI